MRINKHVNIHVNGNTRCICDITRKVALSNHNTRYKVVRLYLLCQADKLHPNVDEPLPLLLVEQQLHSPEHESARELQIDYRVVV